MGVRHTAVEMVEDDDDDGDDDFWWLLRSRACCCEKYRKKFVTGHVGAMQNAINATNNVSLNFAKSDANFWYKAGGGLRPS